MDSCDDGEYQKCSVLLHSELLTQSAGFCAVRQTDTNKHGIFYAQLASRLIQNNAKLNKTITINKSNTEPTSLSKSQ